MSVSDHEKSIKRQESQQKSLENEKELEAKINTELNKEIDEIHQKHSQAQERTVAKSSN